MHVRSLHQHPHRPLHLDRIRDKTGCRRRADLTRLALSAGRYRVRRADADDVGQSVWLRLVDQLGSLRDPAALPGWLATTTQRECGRVLRASRKQEIPRQWLDAADIPDKVTGIAESELLWAEQHAALRDAFTQLPPNLSS